MRERGGGRSGRKDYVHMRMYGRRAQKENESERKREGQREWRERQIEKEKKEDSNIYPSRDVCVE